MKLRVNQIILIFFSILSLDSRIWPRASAVAERLWSNPENPAQMAQARLLRHNDRLRAMGIQTEPITPKYCILNEGQCT